jgi:protein-S-isoprenylcysteine O-methyltransferase Ste14
MRRFFIASGNFFFKYRDLLNPIVFVALCVLTRPMFPLGDPRDTTLIIAGAVLVLAGQMLRAAVIGFAYIKRGGKNKKIFASTLVREGFFAHCRNPLYVGNMLTAFGLLVFYGSAAALIIGGIFYLYLYLSITLAEEQFLHGKFGVAYEDYMREVPRYLINFAGMGKTLEGMKYDWRRLIRKEYGTTFSCVATLLGLLAWKSYLTLGRLNARLDRDLAIIAGFAFLGWATARIMKKRGLLGRDEPRVDAAAPAGS